MVGHFPVIHIFDMVATGRNIKFKNAVDKGDNCFWIVSFSTISYCGLVEIDQTIDVETFILPEDKPPEGTFKRLDAAIRSPAKSTISGKVAKVSNTFVCLFLTKFLT